MMSTPPGLPSSDQLGLGSPRRAEAGRVIRRLTGWHVPTRLLVAAVIGVWVLAALLLVWAVASATGPALEPVPVR